MNEIKLSMARPAVSGRLNSYDINALKTPIGKNSVAINHKNCAEFIELVSEKGYVFCPSTFKMKVYSQGNFKQTRVLALSFTAVSIKRISPHAAIEKAERYGLPVWFAYDSFSYENLDPQDKSFCFVFLLRSPFTDLRSAEAAQKALLKIFPEADPNCSVLKVYQGGNECLYLNKDMPTLDAEWLFMNMALWLKRCYGDTNYKKRYLAKFARETGIALNNRSFPDISVVEVPTESHVEKIFDSIKTTGSSDNGSSDIDDKNVTKCIIKESIVKNLSSISYRINFQPENKTLDVLPDTSTPTQKNYSSYRGKDLQQLGIHCQLYQDFLSGERLLSEMELLGLATNIVQIRGGAVKFRNTLSSKSYFSGNSEKLSNWEFYLSYVKTGNPRPCASFCTYCDTCPHGQNVLSTLKPQKHQIEKIANEGEPLVSLDEAWEDFNNKFQKVIVSNERIWHIIKSQTALGKTQAVLELLKTTHLKILLVVPTNKLKREICERAKKMGIPIVVSPSLHELFDELPEYATSRIEALYQEGKSPMSYIKKVIEESDPECSLILRQYLKELDEFNQATGHAITTHRRLTNLDVGKYDIVIVDEDILYSTVIPNRETIAISDLEKIKKGLPASDPLAIKIKKIVKQRKTSRYFTVSEVNYSNTHAGIEVAANIPALCAAKFFCFRSASDYEENLMEDSVTFIKPVRFQDNMKYIMLSATADRDICEYYFGPENMRFYTCKEAEIAGTLNLYGDRPWGRNTIRKDPAVFSKITKWTGAKHTISFKEFHGYYDGDLHYGNCAGCDTKKGEDTDVIGTPHQPWWIYELFAYSLGYTVDEKPVPNTTAIRNGFRFPFYTYHDQTLQNIQFYMIQSELEQAVGRARLLRYDCTVNLFSDFPLRQAVLGESEFDDS